MENYNSIVKEIGYKIKFMRIAKHISSVKLAQMIGISRQQLQSYESGKIDIKIDRLYDIAKVLGVDMISFFDDSSNTIENDIDLSIFPKLNQIKDAKIKESIYGLLIEIYKNE